MGSGQSARKLTVINEDKSDVIVISNSVAQRLRQQASEGRPEVVNEVRPTTPEQSSVNKVVSPQIPQEGDTPGTGYSANSYPQLTLSAIDVQQQKYKELLNQDQYWQKRLQNLEKHHTHINQIIDEEYQKATEQLYINGQKKGNVEEGAQSFADNIEKVLKCYQDNPKEILKCTSLVEEFSNSVDQRRANVIAARC